MAIAPGMSSVRLTWQFHLVTACVIPTKLVSWKASVPSNDRTHLSGHQYQRRGVHQCVGQSGHGVRGPWARGDEANPYAAADAGVALCGMYGALFMADKDVAQPVAVVEKRIVNGDDGSSGIPEKRVHALAQERFEQGLATL